MRQIVLDTETTGLEHVEGHRIIEIGAVEIIGRRLTGRHFHHYLNPDREVDEGALEVHGLSNDFLADKPRFEDIFEAFVAFVRGAELVIHNAPFDVGFIDAEFARLPVSPGRIAELCAVTDSLVLARRRHPGQKNGLDALCRRYGVDNSERELHGALLDAEILADVYLAMTGGQTSLSLGADDEREGAERTREILRLPADRPRLRVVRASPAEAAAHDELVAELEEASGTASTWRVLSPPG